MAGVKTEGRLTLARVLDWLAEDGLLDRERADVLKRNMTTHQRHPLSVIAERHFSSEKPPHGLLSLDVLS